MLLGTLAFEETIHHGALGIAGSLAGFIVMVGGIVVLAGAQSAPASEEPSASAVAGSA